jgi:hypothetical protein
MVRAGAAVLVVLAVLASIADAGPRRRCRRACRDEIRGCVSVLHRPLLCRHRMIRACLKEGIAVCRPEGISTTTTTSTVPSGPTETTTTTTLPTASRAALGVFEQPFGERAAIRVGVLDDGLLFQLTPITKRFHWCDAGLRLTQGGRSVAVGADGPEARIAYYVGPACGDVPDTTTVAARISDLPPWFVLAKRFFVEHGDNRLRVP